jgi:PAS domain S-box-containing protein
VTLPRKPNPESRRSKPIGPSVRRIKQMVNRINTQRQAAIEARELAETSLRGALEQRRVAEAEAASSTLRLESLVESAMDAIIAVDEDQRVVLFNRAAETMFRCPAAEAIGQPLDRFIPPRFRPVHRAHVEAFGRSGTTNRRMGALGSVTGLRADGEEFPAEASISQITVGERKYFTVILRDITERQRMENLLQASEERFRRITELSPDAIFIYRDDRIVFVNRQGLKLLGATSPDHVLGRSPLDFVHPDSRTGVREKIHQLLSSTDTVSIGEARFIKLDGSAVEVEVTAASFADADGLAIQMVARDITEQKRVEQQLRRTERLAELGTLAAGMAHEIGTPMNVILGRAEQLMRKTDDEATRRALATITAQVERITKIMNQLLTFARRKPGERRAVNLGQTLDDCLEVLQERIRRARVKVDSGYETMLHPVYVYADPDQMSQVFLNLFINALHAMPEGGTLRISVEPVNGQVKTVVADTGCGIPPEDLPKIFLPFFTTKESGQGTGLGLTVVHNIVQEHGGTITVASEPGQGATFTITLPAATFDNKPTRHPRSVGNQ